VSKQPRPPFPRFSADQSDAVLLCALGTLNHVVLNGGRVAVSLAGLAAGLSTVTVGLLIAVFAVLPMLTSVRLGRLVDQIGVQKPLRLGVWLVGVGAILPFAWVAVPTLMIAGCCIGVGFALVQVAMQNQLSQGDADTRLRNFSWMSLAFAVSGFSGPLLAGLAIDHLGHRYAFGLLALGPLLSLAVLKRLRGRLVPPSPPRDPDVQPRLADLLAVPGLRRVLGANMMLSGAWDTHMFVVPLFGVSIGLSATVIGAILASFAAATFVIRLALPAIQRRVRSWSLVRTALAGACLNFLLYPLFTDVAMLMTLSFVLGLALGCSQPSILALLHHYAPPGRAAEAFGMRLALINGSQVSLPLAFGALGAAVGVTPLFWAYAVLPGTGVRFNRRAADMPDQEARRG